MGLDPCLWSDLIHHPLLLFLLFVKYLKHVSLHHMATTVVSIMQEEMVGCNDAYMRNILCATWLLGFLHNIAICAAVQGTFSHHLHGDCSGFESYWSP